MIKAEIYEYIKRANSHHNVISINKTMEKEDIMFYTLIHRENDCPLPRTVLLVALKLSTRMDYWVCWSPTEQQAEVLGGEFYTLFKEIWNSNIENKKEVKK